MSNRSGSLAKQAAHHGGLLGPRRLAARGLLVAALTTAAVLAMVVPASAALSGTTTTTFSLTGGVLSVTPQGVVALTHGAPGAVAVSGSLGITRVSDLRGSTQGWVMSASSTSFADGAGNTSTDVIYDSGAVTNTGTVTPTSTGATAILTAAAVVKGTAVSGNNTASFTPTLTVLLPAHAPAGVYTGLVTNSVL